MNIQNPDIGKVMPEKLETYPRLSRDYPDDFGVDQAYINTLPDLQNGPSSLIRGARRQIQHVGISNFRLPVRYHTRDGGDLTLETSITGSVSLEADKKGINMSRIMRSFYKYADETFSFEVMETALEAYKTDLDSFDARIQMRFSFPMKVDSLRSGLSGYQYYDIAVSICSTCLKRVDGKIVFEDDRVIMQKRCTEHGMERVMIADDVEYYRRMREVFIKPSEIATRLRANGLRLTDLSGMSYNPLTQGYRLGQDIDVNYLVAAEFDA